VAGTSCASPTAAALFSLLNDVRLQNGKSTLGFLNPLIYANTDAFNDVTTGSSQGCGFLSDDGWPAKKGWDAVTGVGTPNYAKLVKVVSNLPPGPSPVPPAPPSPPAPPPTPTPPAPPSPSPQPGDCLAQDTESDCNATTKGGKVCKWCLLKALGIGICENPTESCNGARGIIV